jgi:mRNA-degrading endonuclease RelE of RelBE toxin-antitoxin system
MQFEFDFSPDALAHLRPLRRFDQTTIISAIEVQLRSEPLKPTRRRKPMRSNLISAWELRVGQFRVYYDVDEARRVVLVRAIGVKDRNRVFIAGEEVDLS